MWIHGLKISNQLYGIYDVHPIGLLGHTVYIAISVRFFRGHAENCEGLGGGTKTSLSSQGLSGKAGSSHSKEAQAAGGQD